MFSLAFLKLYLLFLQEFVLQKKNCPKLKLSVDVAGHKTLTVVNPQAVLLGTSVHFRTQWSAHVLARAYFSTWSCFETNWHPSLRCALLIWVKILVYLLIYLLSCVYYSIIFRRQGGSFFFKGGLRLRKCHNWIFRNSNIKGLWANQYMEYSV